VEVKTAIEINKAALVTMRARQVRAQTFTAQRGAAAFVTIIFPASVVAHWSMSAPSANRTDVQWGPVTLQDLDDIRPLVLRLASVPLRTITLGVMVPESAPGSWADPV
jgi:hypothetical protein